MPDWGISDIRRLLAAWPDELDELPDDLDRHRMPSDDGGRTLFDQVQQRLREAVAVARLEIVFRPFRAPGPTRPTGPRGTEAHPYVRCIYRSAGGATNMYLMTGAVELEPYAVYEVDAVFLNPVFALRHVRAGEEFDVPSTRSALGLGRMLRWSDDPTIGADHVGDGRARFPDE